MEYRSFRGHGNIGTEKQNDRYAGDTTKNGLFSIFEQLTSEKQATEDSNQKKDKCLSQRTQNLLQSK